MGKVITISRQFLTGHPRAGQPTYFVEKVMASLADILDSYKIPDSFIDWDWLQYYNARPKHHTIRLGKRFKTGEKVSLRIWSGQPYRSKQIILAPDIEVTVFDVVVHTCLKEDTIAVSVNGRDLDIPELLFLMDNDGLDVRDFMSWFRTGDKDEQTVEGQIICWNPKISY